MARQSRRPGGQGGSSGWKFNTSDARQAEDWAAKLEQATRNLADNFGRLAGSVVAIGAALGTLPARVGDYARAVGGGTTFAERFAEANKRLADQAKQQSEALRTLTGAYALATAAGLGWVRAGFQGTTAGEMLSFQTKQLSMQIGALFLPLVEKLTDRIARTVEWFRNLSGAQQDQIARWAALSVGMLGALTLLPRLATAVRSLGGALAMTATGNPLLALFTGLAGLMTITEGGREGLARLAQGFEDAFGPAVAALVDTLAGALEAVANVLGTTEGQLAALGIVFAAAIPRMIAGVLALAAAFTTVRGAITLGIGALAALLVMASQSGKETRQTLQDIAAAVRSGRMSREQAEERLREYAQEEAFKAGLKFAEPGPFEEFGRVKELREKLGQKAMEDREREIMEMGRRYLDQTGKGRRDLVPAISGTETDPRATIRRLEESFLKTDAQKRTADNTGGIFRLMEQMFNFFKQFAPKGGEEPGKAD